MATNHPSSRFVILHHDVGASLSRTAESHYDWMFEVDGILQTWATAPVEAFDQSFEVDSERLHDHRLAYLEFEGDIEGDRGRVQRVLSGTFHRVEADDQRLMVVLLWEDRAGRHRAEAEFYRILADERSRVDDNRAVWRLRFSPCR